MWRVIQKILMAIVCICVIVFLFIGVVIKKGNTTLNKNTSATQTEAYLEKTLKLYFSYTDMGQIFCENREVSIKENDSLVDVIIAELEKGPRKKLENAPNSVPKGTKVLSSNITNGICYLNLSKEFVDNANRGIDGEKVTIMSIVNSLTELPNIKKVQFEVEGIIRNYYISQPLRHPIARFMPTEVPS